MKSIKEKIQKRIERLEAGYAFSARDFLRDFRRYEVDVALSSLVKEGFIRRVIPGIYEYPRFSELLQCQVATDIDELANYVDASLDIKEKAEKCLQEYFQKSRGEDG